ncbi:MAG: sensor histidine kinase [Myxococcota bacterium]
MNVGFARRLSLQTTPLLIVLVVLVTVSAPAAYHWVRVGELRTQTTQQARVLARQLAREAARRPVLWRYDSGKLADALQSDHPSIARTIVFDEAGSAVVEFGSDEGALLWTSAPISTGGTVWMAAELRPARLTALGLLIPFVLLGLMLAAALWWLPRRALFEAEAQIRALVSDLESLNRTLESQVQDRVADLERAYASLAERDRRLRDLSSRAALMQEAERRDIARDLHDGAGQTLTAVRLQLQLLPEDQRVGRAVSLLDEAIDEVRRALDSLAPAVLDEVGLGKAVARLCQTVAETSGLHVECVSEGLDAIDAAIEATAYRIVQEALHNVVRHAEATRADVELAQTPSTLTLVVRDDGRGFAPDEAAAGRGLRGMEERTELLQGTWALTRPKSGGTEVRVNFPLHGASDPSS